MTPYLDYSKYKKSKIYSAEILNLIDFMQGIILFPDFLDPPWIPSSLQFQAGNCIVILSMSKGSGWQ